MALRLLVSTGIKTVAHADEVGSNESRLRDVDAAPMRRVQSLDFAQGKPFAFLLTF